VRRSGRAAAAVRGVLLVLAVLRTEVLMRCSSLDDGVAQDTKPLHLQLDHVRGLQEAPHLDAAATAVAPRLRQGGGAGAEEFAGYSVSFCET